MITPPTTKKSHRVDPFVVTIVAVWTALVAADAWHQSRNIGSTVTAVVITAVFARGLLAVFEDAGTWACRRAERRVQERLEAERNAEVER